MPPPARPAFRPSPRPRSPRHCLGRGSDASRTLRGGSHPSNRPAALQSNSGWKNDAYIILISSAATVQLWLVLPPHVLGLGYMPLTSRSWSYIVAIDCHGQDEHLLATLTRGRTSPLRGCSRPTRARQATKMRFQRCTPSRPNSAQLPLWTGLDLPHGQVWIGPAPTPRLRG